MLAAFTLFHVLLSLIGIGAGCIALAGMLSVRRMEGITQIFFWTTVATSVTGFMFPVDRVMPGHIVGVLSLIVLAFAYVARYRRALVGSWGRTYVITSTIALYFNVFVLVVQMFQKIGVLHELAPTQSEPPFQIAQLVVLVAFIALGTLAVKRFRFESLRP